MLQVASAVSAFRGQRQKSADAVRKMSIEERTRRAMAAEAAEDRILELAGELEDAQTLGDAAKCEELQKQIEATRQQYSDLVGGGSSFFVDAVAGVSGQSGSPPDQGES